MIKVLSQISSFLEKNLLFAQYCDGFMELNTHTMETIVLYLAYFISKIKFINFSKIMLSNQLCSVSLRGLARSKAFLLKSQWQCILFTIHNELNTSTAAVWGKRKQLAVADIWLSTKVIYLWLPLTSISALKKNEEIKLVDTQKSKFFSFEKTLTKYLHFSSVLA